LERVMARPGAASLGAADAPPIAWLDHIAVELDRMVAALGWLGEHGDPGRAMYLAHGILRFWSDRRRRFAIVAQRAAQHGTLRRGVAAALRTDYRAAHALCDASRAAVAAVGRRARARPRALEPTSAGRLTRREREVAALVAQGLTNREIAARLVVTVPTASTHVVHILNKLGFRSRAQIAAWAAEQRLTPCGAAVPRSEPR
jgi:non-specific serine/threonine protein kinase